jgi:hypothetical protein
MGWGGKRWHWRGADCACGMSKVLRFDADGNEVWVDKGATGLAGCTAQKDIVSDSLGCTLHNVDDMREDAKKNGFHVDFVTDRGPSAVDGFYPCKGSPSEIARYEKHRQGSAAEYGSAGAAKTISVDELEAAQRLVRQKYGTKEAA